MPSKIEILMLIFNKIRILGFMFLLFYLVLILMMPILIDDPVVREHLIKNRKKLILFFVVCLCFSLLPSTEDIWKVRIGLIKFQLASPENIKKGTDEIAVIAKKLECKYLGCEDSK